MSNVEFDPLDHPISFHYLTPSEKEINQKNNGILTLEDLILELQMRLNQDLREIHGQDRTSRRVDLAYLENTFENMSKNHNSIAWKHSIKFIGAVIGCFAAGFDQNNNTGRLISFISESTKQGGDFTIAFNQSEAAKLQGLTEQLRDAISQDNKDAQEVQRLISQIDQTLSSAYDRACRSRNSPFHPQ
jgi:hypothetical protein